MVFKANTAIFGANTVIFRANTDIWGKYSDGAQSATSDGAVQLLCRMSLRNERSENFES